MPIASRIKMSTATTATGWQINCGVACQNSLETKADTIAKAINILKPAVETGRLIRAPKQAHLMGSARRGNRSNINMNVMKLSYLLYQLLILRISSYKSICAIMSSV